MAIVNRVKDMPCLAIRKKLGSPGGFGDYVFGLSRLGYFCPKNGVYQMRYPLKPGMVYTYDKKKPKIAHRLRYSWPSNPRTAGQQANRMKFKDGIVAWKALENNEKDLWRAKAKKLNTYGSSLFLRAYMLDRELKP